MRPHVVRIGATDQGDTIVIKSLTIALIPHGLTMRETTSQDLTTVHGHMIMTMNKVDTDQP